MKEELDALLNTALVDTFKNILKLEEKMIRANSRLNLSISEMHLLESVGKSDDNGRTISEIASDLDIKLSSVTIAVNKLTSKGYVSKSRGVDDGRTVIVKLTQRGKKVDHIHKGFHRRMIHNITSILNSEEEAIVIKVLHRLNDYFTSKIEHSEDNNEL